MVDARPKKPASDRRKQQNRIAQKGYRERQKRRMKALERLLDTQDYCEANSADGVTPTTNFSPESGPANKTTLRADSPCRNGSPAISVATKSCKLPVTQTVGPLTQAGAVDTPDWPLTEPVLNQLMQETNDVDETVYNRIISGEIPISQIFLAGLRHFSIRQPHNPLRENKSLTDRPGLPLRTDRILVPENRMRIHAHALPDMYASHLRLKQFNTISALRASVESLGINFEMLSSPDTVSPFYRGSLSKDAAEMVIAKETFEDVAPHLRPTIAQIRHPHHAYIDALPFPTFRERVIEACSLESPILDEEDLCDDLEKGGLICWGSYLGDGNVATGSGAPWDYRSWEAQPWFLKKWWFFIGGVQGELFQQTRWWHEMRGDRLVAP